MDHCWGISDFLTLDDGDVVSDCVGSFYCREVDGFSHGVSQKGCLNAQYIYIYQYIFIYRYIDEK